MEKKNYQKDGYQHRSYGGGQDQTEKRNFAGDFNKEWVMNAIDKNCINYTKDLGEFLAKNKLSSSQIRNVYGELKRIQMKGFDKERTAFLLLRPKMAYADKRNEGAGLRELKKVFDKAYDLVEEEKQFKNFMDFMESTLAYHKAFGGK
jgi:CRISPR-associated protein Csm2